MYSLYDMLIGIYSDLFSESSHDTEWSCDLFNNGLHIWIDTIELTFISFR